MCDLQPIAKQTGNALNQVLLSVDKEFQSGTWQQFFKFLAAQAGPDVRLLGQNFTDLLQALPPLIQDLTPLGNVLLHVSDDAFKAAWRDRPVLQVVPAERADLQRAHGQRAAGS